MTESLNNQNRVEGLPAEGESSSGSQPLTGRTAGDRLFNDLQAAIQGGQLQVGDKLAPARELAQRYGIAFNTARAALGRLEAAGLVDRRPGSGTFVTEPTSSTPSTSGGPLSSDAAPRSVALLIRSTGHLYGPLHEDLAGRLHHAGLFPFQVGSQTDNDEQRIAPLLEMWRREPPRGVVCQFGGFIADSLARTIPETIGDASRLVALFRPPPHGGWDAVYPDMEKAGALAAEYLIAGGHRRIGAVVCYRRALSEEHPTQQRKRTANHTAQMLGVGRYMRGVGLRHGLTIHHNPPRCSVFSEQAVDALCQWLRRPDAPTAVVGQDVRMVTVIRAAQRLGLRVPEDLAVVGIGDTPWARAYGFPSVSLRPDLLAEHVCELLATRPVARRGSSCRIVVEPELTPADRDQPPVAADAVEWDADEVADFEAIP